MHIVIADQLPSSAVELLSSVPGWSVDARAGRLRFEGDAQQPGVGAPPHTVLDDRGLRSFDELDRHPVDAFGQQFGTWAGRVISAAPLALQAAGFLTGNAAIGGAGSGMGIMGALKTGYGLYQGGYMPGDYLSPQSIGSLASGAGSIMSLVGGLTGIKGLSYAGMGVQGAVLATQIVSSLVPQVATAITGAGATIASSIGGSVGSWAGGAVGGLAGLPSLATAIGLILRPEGGRP